MDSPFVEIIKHTAINRRIISEALFEERQFQYKVVNELKSGGTG